MNGRRFVVCGLWFVVCEGRTFRPVNAKRFNFNACEHSNGQMSIPPKCAKGLQTLKFQRFPVFFIYNAHYICYCMGYFTITEQPYFHILP
nr:MAG TPA: hypothetical protein [Caudoviricetes sp.]